MAKRKKKNTVLGLDLGTQAIKAVEMTRNGEKLSITGCAYEPVEDPTRYNEAIKGAIDAGAFRTNRVVVGFSGRSTMIQTVTLPGDRVEDLDAAMLEEAEKYVPYDISEAQIDYHVFETEDTHLVKALLVAVRQRDIEDKLEILFNAGITPMMVDVELVALANALETANTGGFFVTEGRGTALVDMGATKTLISVTDGVSSVFREFPVGGIALTEMISQRLGCDMAEAEKLKLEPGDRIETIKDAIYPGIEDIAAEVRACADIFKGASGGREATFLLASGGLVAFSGVTPLLGRLAKMESRIFDSFGSIDSSEVDQSHIGPHAHEFAVALGLSCHARD